MKRLLLSSIVLLLFLNLRSQVVMPDSYFDNKPYHQHRGFYLSMGAGLVFGKVTDRLQTYTMDFRGTGGIFDFRIGGAVAENVIIHCTIVSMAVPGPTITYSTGSSGKAHDNMSIAESMVGAGVTIYTPSNLFISGSAGIGDYSIIDDQNSANNATTHEGFSMQLKAGKEWWISDKWALGIAFTYGKTKLTNRVTGAETERLDSNRFGILFSASFSK